MTVISLLQHGPTTSNWQLQVKDSTDWTDPFEYENARTGTGWIDPGNDDIVDPALERLLRKPWEWLLRGARNLGI